MSQSGILEVPVPQPTAQQRRRSFLIVLFCTFLAAAAQLLIKRGAGQLGANASLLDAAWGIFTNAQLFTGYALYGLFTVALIFALRHGELSLLYPVISASYVWVSIISVLVLKEHMNAPKMAGVVLIVLGVGFLGRGNKQ